MAKDENDAWPGRLEWGTVPADWSVRGWVRYCRRMANCSLRPDDPAPGGGAWWRSWADRIEAAPK